jgi:hypothetical protein
VHTYASLDELKSYFVDGGSAYGTANDAGLLALLESSSRRVEGYCGRSPANQSGFGPRTGTNAYDAQGWYGGFTLYRDNMVMDLNDDLLTATTVTVLDQTGGTPTTMTEGTDFYLQPYNNTPKRTLVVTGLGQSYLVPGLKILSLAGTWGYAQEIATTGATLGTVSASATTAIITGGGLSVGNTMRVGSEDIYISATTAGSALVTTGGTVTVSRGANGTTAAVQAAGAAISVHRYPREVVDTTIRVAQRRWKMRDAGLTASFGGGAMPGTTFGDSERAILGAAVGHLRIMAIG